MVWPERPGTGPCGTGKRIGHLGIEPRTALEAPQMILDPVRLLGNLAQAQELRGALERVRDAHGVFERLLLIRRALEREQMIPQRTQVLLAFLLEDGQIFESLIH
jgi:hypothetical protein